MGWQDAPLVDAAPPPTRGKWMDAPEVDAPATVQPVSLMDKVLGSVAGRTALGMAAPLMGAAQAGAHLGDALNELTGTHGTVSPWLDKQLQALEASKRRGLEHYQGKDAWDIAGVMGSLLPSAKIAKGVQAVLPAVTGPVSRAVQAGAQGTAVGLVQPSEGKDYASEKALQGGLGGLLGFGMSAGTDLLKGAGKVIGDVVRPITEKGRAKILDLYQQGLVPEMARPKVAAALRDQQVLVPGSKPTAGELAAHIPESTSLASHQAVLEKMSHPVATAPQFAARRGAQEAARLAPIDEIAGTADELARAVELRNVATAPLRTEALAKAGMGNKYIPGLEKTIVKGENGIRKASSQLSKLEPAPPAAPLDALRSSVEIHGVPPTPLVSQRDVLMKQLLPEQIANRQGEIEAAKQTIQMLKDAGLQQLKPDAVLRSVKASLLQPGYRASDVVQKTLGSLEEKLTSLKSKNGTIDPFDLYMVRRELGNTVQKFAEETKTFDKKLTSGILNGLQGAIDDTIEGAGGKGWKDYLATYSQLSGDINRMEKGRALKDALLSPLETKERGTVFANAFNKDRDELAKILTDKQMQSVDAVKADLARYDEYLKRARQSTAGGSDAIPGNVEPALPNILSRPAMIANYIIKKFGEGAEDKIAIEAARRYLHDPEAIAKALLRADQPSRYQQILDAMMRQAPTVGGVAAGQAGRNQ